MVVEPTRIHGLEKLSPMDCWNPHTPSLWDWENPLLINGKACETPKQCWGIEGDGGLETGSGGYSPGGCGRSGSDLVNGSSSKSSISASIDDSQFNAEVKASELNFQTIERFPDDFDKNKELPPGEPLIGLKLGRRTYFEDIFAGNTVKSSSLSLVQSPTDSVKKARLSCHSMQNPLCQVEGCNVDLSGAKDYHRRHRVCENHSKCPKVIVSGLERRFCQQCSRFHELSEFDEKKRSCRRRLYDHNARRRKPQTSTISFSSARLPSSFHVYADGRQQMNLLLNKVPLVHTSQENITWENSCDFKLSQAKGSCLRTAKGEGIDGHLHLPNLEFSNAISTLRCHDFDKLLSFKGATAEVPNQGLEASMMTSNLDSMPDIRSALSLLSTSTWGLSDRESASLDQIMQVNHTSVAHPTMHTNYQGLPLSSSETLQAQHPSAEPQVSSLALHNNGGQFQEFQLFKEPFESAFFDNNHIH